MQAICVQKNGARGPVTSMATTSAPSPPGKPLVSRSQAKKYRSTQVNTASIFARFTMEERSMESRPAFCRAMTTTSTSAVPQSSAEATNHGPIRAVCQNSWAADSEKIQAVTVCTPTATTRAMMEMTRMAVCDIFPSSSRR